MRRNPMHTRAGKRAFIRALCRSVEREILRAVPNMPNEWDGNELREMLASVFHESRSTAMRENRARRRAFDNERLVRNLP